MYIFSWRMGREMHSCTYFHGFSWRKGREIHSCTYFHGEREGKYIRVHIFIEKGKGNILLMSTDNMSFCGGTRKKSIHVPFFWGG